MPIERGTTVVTTSYYYYYSYYSYYYYHISIFWREIQTFESEFVLAGNLNSKCKIQNANAKAKCFLVLRIP